MIWVGAWLPGTATALTPSNDEDVEKATVRVFVRIASVKSNSLVVIDRGASDGVQRSDVVTFYPRDGREYRGTVIQVNDRNATIELLDDAVRPSPGTRGDFIVRASRLLELKRAAGEIAPARPTSEDDTAERNDAKDDAETGTGTDSNATTEASDDAPRGESATSDAIADSSRWTRRDDWKPGMPLLAQVEPVHPRDRSRRLTGRAWIAADANRQGGRGSDALLRTGTDLDYDNPFGLGGRVRFDGEMNYRSIDDPDDGDESDGDFRIDRFSYAFGGTRYASTRIEVGRFLHYGVPEFGILDGIEWGQRRDNGDRFGASIGLLPELDYDLSGSSDLSLAAYYYWVSDTREQLLFGGAYQKTWHDGDADRDLFLAKVRYLPIDGWRAQGTLWIDYYDSSDDAKDATFELTQAYVTVNRTWRDEGIDFTYRRIKFPELLRDEFRPVLAVDLDRNRYDRLAANGWRWLTKNRRLHGQVGIWNDEDDTGGDAELGLDIQDLFVDGGRGDVTAFGTRGQFERAIGARVSYGRYGDGGSWNVLYEIVDHRLDGFSSDRDDLIQHRVRGTLDFYMSAAWTLSLYGEGGFWDDDSSIAGGVYVQTNF